MRPDFSQNSVTKQKKDEMPPRVLLHSGMRLQAVTQQSKKAIIDQRIAARQTCCYTLLWCHEKNHVSSTLGSIWPHHWKYSRNTQFVINPCLLFEKCSGVHNTRIFYFWHWLQTILLCFSQVVLWHLLQVKLYFFSFDLGQRKHLLRPDGGCWVMVWTTGGAFGHNSLFYLKITKMLRRPMQKNMGYSCNLNGTMGSMWPQTNETRNLQKCYIEIIIAWMETANKNLQTKCIVTWKLVISTFLIFNLSNKPGVKLTPWYPSRELRLCRLFSHSRKLLCLLNYLYERLVGISPIIKA